MHRSAIVVGAGIVGLATARALALRGYQVTVLERNERAVGASIRNFGMVWPIGQPEGFLFNRAMASRNIWKTICSDAGIWHEEAGSLHLAYSAEEEAVLEEFYNAEKEHRGLQLLSVGETMEQYETAQPSGLRLALHSPTELIVDPREAIQKIPAYLAERYGVRFRWSCGATGISRNRVECGPARFEADQIFVCNGADFETLFPNEFSVLPLTKCKLQMMRTGPQPARIKTALCGGLSLLHYKSFAAAPSLQELRKKVEAELPDYIKWGIHVMISQNESGQLTIGDSHEYGQVFDPFNKAFINELILSYLRRLARIKNENITETWNGVYAKSTAGHTELVLHPMDGVTVINGLGGAGMTLSFGLCEEVVAQRHFSGITAAAVAKS
jgi:FAD dependent oxidoreductase TIGR03364